MVIEERTHFVERTAGRYLNKQNEGREAWGRSWERQISTHQAAKQLDEKVVETGKLRIKAELVADFGELFNVIPEGEGVPISPSKLVELYRKLPEALKISLIQPDRLLDMYWGGNWARTSVWRKGDNLAAYLVDARNRVLEHLTISRSLVKASTIFGQTRNGLLSDELAYGDNIYSSDKFFSSYWELSPAEREEIFSDPDLLLSLPKPIIRVGFRSLSEIDGFGLIGFESGDYRGSVVTSFPINTASMELLEKLFVEEEAGSALANSATLDSISVAVDSLLPGVTDR